MSTPVTQLTFHQSLQSLPMNTTISEQLEALAFQAFKNGDQQIADKILKLIAESGNPIKVTAEVEKPVKHASENNGKTISFRSTEARTKEFWRWYLLENFFPEMKKYNRVSFSRSHVEDWIEITQTFDFNLGDLNINSEGYARWKKNISNALQGLKTDGLIRNKKHSNTWYINWSQFPK